MINGLNFITEYLFQIIIGIIILLLVIFSIIFRKKLKKKIKNETISFIAMTFSFGMAFIGLITEPKAVPSGTLAIVNGGLISWAFPVTFVFGLIALVLAINFFSKK